MLIFIHSSDEEEMKAKKEPGLFDFLTDDSKDKSEKPKPKKRPEKSFERQQTLRKSISHDSITEELEGTVNCRKLWI